MQVAQWGRHPLATAFQDDIIARRVSGASVETQREGKVLTIAQQLISQVRNCGGGEELSLKRSEEWRGKVGSRTGFYLALAGKLDGYWWR